MAQTMPTSNTLSARFNDLLGPLQLLMISFLTFPRVLMAHPLLPLTSPKDFQKVWFAAMWKTIGPQMALSPEQVPYISKMFSRARGVVLELGPGSGDQLRHLTQNVQNGQVERMVAAEPNAILHERLLQNAKSIGLDPEKGRFLALDAGAEPSSLIPALHKAGLYPTSQQGEGIFDTVITVKSLCSVPQHQMREILTTIHTLLKPGGEFMFFEHVANETDYLAMIYTWFVGLLWPWVMGNCHLRGRVDKVAKEMGDEWESVSVSNTREFHDWNCLRYVVGVCKKGTK